MKRGIITALIVIAFCTTALSASASVYVSDKLDAPLRIGPGTEFRIVGMLRSGQAVEVITEKQGWSNVRTTRESGGKEGWILTRYLMSREPWERRVKSLEAENAKLRETVNPVQGELQEVKARNAEIEKELKKTTEALRTVKNDYEKLKNEASGFLDLKEHFDTTKADLARVQEDLAKVTEENMQLRSSHRHRWFLAGALVLLFGLIIGLIMGRREKKRTSKLYL